VQDLELRLDIRQRWVPGEERWDSASRIVRHRQYQRALDHLQALVISRMFELTKMNMSGTSMCISTIVHLYMFGASAKSTISMANPFASTLHWPHLPGTHSEPPKLNYLSMEVNGISEPWALPVGRVAMDQHYKLLRADEEIQRLNIEIQRLVTHM
ncbi:hypothetical protein B0H10DRAFT_1656724, partial [Mycena sp. CBHHK59/15]